MDFIFFMRIYSNRMWKFSPPVQRLGEGRPTNESLAQFVPAEWAQEFDPDFGAKLTADIDYAVSILAI